LRERGLEVTIVAPSRVPFEKTLGAEIGELFRQLHESHGVQFKLGATVARFEGTQNVEAVTLANGERIETDMVVVGVGVRPVTQFLQGVELGQDGGVLVDSRLSAAENVYAAGDIASFPDPRTGQRTRIEHWRTALQQGRAAARNMIGRDEPFTGVPFFWTRQFNVTLGYVGHAKTWDEIIYQGDVSAHKFLAFYVQDDRVTAVAGMKHDREMAAVQELMRLDLLPTREQLKRGEVNLLEMLQCPA
jgi:NADPH-dependent 2,4-dienoyl-CoA reductase/sulfur reductase-like enzyme